ncbi:hypothetical protein OLMES_2969 [Oleiphilus messinensis]|uniref:Uncharacterized protein n=1 Tax=Oleiphilus messinensis TaxID=141451 RepID=A0A1Y0ICB0_9GAMM|nr:hypothetical protein [Oleiphilus messinensis]ARU57013.1 hypothetical protein OLMES_2969 [Oleiphilus messinensis]
MSKSQTEHARNVVAAFKEKISRSGIEHIGEKHFAELELLIESAIDSAVYIELERAAEKVAETARELKRSAERFD